LVSNIRSNRCQDFSYLQFDLIDCFSESLLNLILSVVKRRLLPLISSEVFVVVSSETICYVLCTFPLRLSKSLDFQKYRYLGLDDLDLAGWYY
jgi:hypothetical protein